MENKIKTILIIFATVLGASLFLTGSAFADDNLVVEFEKTPLFQEANFLPGQEITRWVEVTNNGIQSQRIAAEAINVKDLNRLGDVLNLEIKEGGTRLYNNALSKFFTEGEVYLSNLAGGKAQTQYDFIVTFYSGTGNPFQGKSLNFDILVGFQGEEGGLLPGAGGGAGGFLPPGLTIIEPVSVISGVTTATITWQTSYESTSRVVYGTTSRQFSLSAGEPSYGYEFYSDEDSTKTKNHLIILTGLTSGTTYYYRCVSHGSLAISTEYSFTTLGVKEVGEEGEEIIEGKPAEGEVEGVGEKEPAFTEVTAGKEEKEETVGDLEGPELVEVGLEKPTGLGKFLAAVGGLPFNLKVILIIVGLILIILIILWLIRKRERNLKRPVQKSKVI